MVFNGPQCFPVKIIVIIYAFGSAHEKFNEVAPHLKKAISELQKLSLLQMQNLPCKTEFYLHEIKKKHFNINSFALSLALKQRIGATLYWPIPMSATRT